LFGQLSQQTVGVSLDDGSLPRFPSRAATPTINGSFVGEGNPIPVRRIGFTATTLTHKKLAVLSPFSNSPTKARQPNVEQILQTVILSDSRAAVDAVLIGSSAASAVAPAGILNGLSSLTPSAVTNSYDRMIADIRGLLNAIGTAYRPALLANA